MIQDENKTCYFTEFALSLRFCFLSSHLPLHDGRTFPCENLRILKIFCKAYSRNIQTQMWTYVIGKTYPIFDGKEKKYYDEKYPHLAVELRNGGGTQTSSSDVYSFGYVMKLVSHTLKDRLLSTLYRSCRSVCPDDRPNISNVEQSISILR